MLLSAWNKKLSKRIDKLLCLLGFHEWVKTHDYWNPETEWGFPRRECSKCCKEQHLHRDDWM